jgi:hypothetical protein
MDLRKSLSKPFKKARRKLAEVGRKRDKKSRREPDVEGSEASQRSSRLYLEAEDAVESGPSREGDDVSGEDVGWVDPPASTLSIPPHST